LLKPEESAWTEDENENQDTEDDDAPKTVTDAAR
jgi:hypothetical protein